jgi:hypothetical protein
MLFNDIFSTSLCLISPFLRFISGASISDRSQAENLGEERISVRRSLTDSLAVSSMLLLQPQQVSIALILQDWDI